MSKKKKREKHKEPEPSAAVAEPDADKAAWDKYQADLAKPHRFGVLVIPPNGEVKASVR